jgi:Zn ribbon nucleic-acid-binding protein
VTVDLGQPCPACGSTSTYWIFSAVDSDAWDCGSCGHQWTVTIDKSRVGGRRGHQTTKDD